MQLITQIYQALKDKAGNDPQNNLSIVEFSWYKAYQSDLQPACREFLMQLGFEYDGAAFYVENKWFQVTVYADRDVTEWIISHRHTPELQRIERYIEVQIDTREDARNQLTILGFDV